MALNNKFLKEPKSFLGSKRLLFHRLVDEAPHETYESGDYALLDKEGVKESIDVELHRLLNTRSSFRVREVDADDEEDFGIFGYGIADFSKHDATNQQEWHGIAENIKKAIDRYEPRLKNVQVEVVKFDEKKQKLHVFIKGFLNVKKMEGEATFDIALECAGEN